MPRSLYQGGKARRHFTLSEQAFAHLSNIATSAKLSRSETLERLIRSTQWWEGEAILADSAWPFATDHSNNDETF